MIKRSPKAATSVDLPGDMVAVWGARQGAMAKPTSRLDVRGGDMASQAALRGRRHPRRAVGLGRGNGGRGAARAAVTATLCATGVTAAFASASPSVSGSGGTVRLIVQTAKGLSA